MFKPGTQVRFTRNNLGLVRFAGDGRFEDKRVNEGDLGVYDAPHPHIHAAGWHMIKVGDLFCPCHESQFEVVNV